MFNFFGKKRISPQEMAYSLFSVLVEDDTEDSLRDSSGNIILIKQEKYLLRLSHLSRFLDNHDLQMVKNLIFSLVVQSKKKIKGDTDFALEMLVLADSVAKINSFLDSVATSASPEKDFLQTDSLFDRKLNLEQKTLIWGWYFAHAKATDSKILNPMMKKFEVIT